MDNQTIPECAPHTARTLDWAGVALTPLDERDLDALHAWQNAPGIRDLTMGFRFPVQREAVSQWLRDLREQKPPTRAVYAIRRAGALLGVAQLHGIDPFQRKAQLGIFIGDEAQRHGGVGTVACRLLLDFAFGGLDLRKVSLEVLAGNAAAIAVYERIGFALEGVRRQEYFLDGRCFDVRLYGIFASEVALPLGPGANRLIRAMP